MPGVKPESSLIGVSLIQFGFYVLCFLPTFVSFFRSHSDRVPVFVLNIPFGIMFMAWLSILGGRIETVTLPGKPIGWIGLLVGPVGWILLMLWASSGGTDTYSKIDADGVEREEKRIEEGFLIFLLVGLAFLAGVSPWLILTAVILWFPVKVVIGGSDEGGGIRGEEDTQEVPDDQPPDEGA